MVFASYIGKDLLEIYILYILFIFDRTLEAVITLPLSKVSIGGLCLQNREKPLIPYLIIRSLSREHIIVICAPVKNFVLDDLSIYPEGKEDIPGPNIVLKKYQVTISQTL